MTNTCATCGWWKVECSRLRGVEHVLARVGCCTACQGTRGVESAMFTWADNGACPAWAEKEDAAARAAWRIIKAEHVLGSREMTDIIREEQAKETKGG